MIAEHFFLYIFMKHVDKHFLPYFASVLILLIQRDVQVLLVRAH